MKFYTQNHQHTCGIDLHTKTMFLCILNNSGEIVLHANIAAQPKPFMKAIQPFREDLVIGVECMFSWYWLADLCLQEDINFILGHALSLYMKAILEARRKAIRSILRKSLG